jgi:hypothetical protein
MLFYFLFTLLFPFEPFCLDLLLMSSISNTSYLSNKSTNYMQQFLKSTTWRSSTAQHVLGVLMSIIRNSTTAVAPSGLPLERGGSSAVVRDRTDHYQQHCYHHAPTVKPEGATAVVELLMMGVSTPETCWAVHEPQIGRLEKFLFLVGWFIWIVWWGTGLQTLNTSYLFPCCGM